MTKAPIGHSELKKSRARSEISRNPLVITLPVTCWLNVNCKWKASFDPNDGEPDGVIGVDLRDTVAFSRIPAHEVRREFLGLKTIPEVLRFSEMYGSIEGHKLGLFTMFSPLLVWEIQDRIRKDRELSPKEFFYPGRKFSWTELFDREPPQAKLLPGAVPSSPPMVEIETSFPYMAMLFANYVDQIAGIRVSTCPLCKEQYDRTSDRVTKFCSDTCQRKAGKAKWNKAHPPKNKRRGRPAKVKEEKHGKA